MENSLSSLVQGVFAQSNLTSFNPAIQNNIYAPLTLNWNLLMYMYKTHGVLQTAIDMPVLDALRGGLEIQSDELDADDIGDLNDWMEEENIISIVSDAVIWARLFGGAALIINTGEKPDTPLNLEKPIKKLRFYAANRWELYSTWKPMRELDINTVPVWNWAAAKDSEYVEFYNQRIHVSRLITLSGKEAPWIIRWQLQGWGMSEYERMLEDFNMYIKTKNVTYDILQEAKLDVYKFEGFKQQLMSAGGTQKTIERVELMNQMKNTNNATILDKNDEFEQKQLTFSGLAEVMKQNMIGMASALRMPMTKLFGLSASGFNSGEDDIENYNAMVESEIRQPLRSVLRKVLRLSVLHKFQNALDIDFEYYPLRVLGEVEDEGVKTSKQNRFVQLYDRQLLSSKELGQGMEKEKLISIPTDMAEGILEDHPDSSVDGFAEGTEEEETASGKAGNKKKSSKEPQ